MARQTIHLAAILARDGRLLLTRERPEAAWELPGGALQPHHPDVDAGMEIVLGEFGVRADDVAGDFVETVYMQGADGPIVYNIYAPQSWKGEPEMPGGSAAGWFPIDELEIVRMDDRVRRSVMAAFGLADAPDDTPAIMAALNRAVGNEPELAGMPTGEPTAAPIGGDARAALSIGILAALGRRAALRRAIEAALDGGLPPTALVETLRVVAHHAGLPAAEDAGEITRTVLGGRGLTIPEGLP